MSQSIKSPTLHLSIVLAILSSLASTAQSDYIKSPEPLEPGDFAIAAGLSITVLPQILVEGEFRQAPLLDFRARYGLPLQLSVEGGVRSNVFTNFVDLQARYAVDLDPFYIGASYRIGWWYGFAPFQGFDIVAQSWLNMPGVEFGTRVNDVRFTLGAEMQYVTSLNIETEGITTNNTRNELSGYTFSMAAEQPFWGETSVALGLRVHYTRSLYQAWLAFPTFEERLFYPEFSFDLLF